MERETKSKDLRGIRPFDAITGVFITVLSVFALLQTNKLESLRREVMELKEINPGHNGNSFDKCEFYFKTCYSSLSWRQCNQIEREYPSK